jgi:hypothetical protein
MKSATELILEAPRIHQNDIEAALTEHEILAIDEFEDSWGEFIASRPAVLPPGEKLRSCLAIDYQIEEVEVSKQNVQMEMQRQLDFFTSSKNQLDSNFTKAMEEAALMQQDVNKRLNKEIADIADADETLSATLPWEHFLDNLDSLVEMTNLAGDTGSTSLALKPSNRALYLANNMDHAEMAVAALEGKSSALLLRSFSIDNALLNAEVRLLLREVDRLEKTTKSQKVLAKFFTEHNIWGLLTKSGAGTTVGGGSSKVSGSRYDTS